MAIDEVRGMRFGLARRLLAAVSGEDIPAPVLSRRLEKGPKAAYRWETGEDRPRSSTVEDLAKLCQEAGLPITAGWLERGETELPPITIPAAALEPRPPQAREKVEQTRLAKEPQAVRAIRKRRPKRRKASGE